MSPRHPSPTRFRAAALTLIPAAGLALLGAASAAHGAGQSAPADAAALQAAAEAVPAAAPAPAQVIVNGSRASDMDARRQSTAGKQIYGREELDRNGDSNLGDILKRLPGVTMGGRPGRGGEIRMRGLGSGYTQVLLNGERAPAGFSMDSLSPDQVERIEVMRGPVAEHSTRAIAGTINIVLRDGYQQRDVQLKLTDTIEQGRHAPNVALTLPGKVGGLSYLLSASLFDNHQQDRSATRNVDTRADGSVAKDQALQEQSGRQARGIHLTPRLSYKFEGGDTLNFQPFLMASRSDADATSRLAQSVGAVAPEYATAQTQSRASSTFLRGFGNWVHKMAGASKLDVKFGFGNGRSDSDSRRSQYDGAGLLLDRFVDTDATRDRSANTGGKYTTPLGQGHLLAAGWDAEWNRREQSRVSLDNGVAQFADSGDNLKADTRRFAGFVQDEWDITPQWSAYFGLRWEGIRATSARGGADVANQSRVWSPLLHAVWRIPGSEKDQVRMSLTHSYRAPSLADLIALPSLSRLNSATRPDRTGNPNLKPELARGIDVAYEHYLGRSGIVSVSGFVRNIEQLMRRETTLQDTPTGPRWVSTPTNIGKARTSGIELEAKFQLVELLENAPAIDIRSNYSRFWSNVEGIPGPNNRLDQQAKQTANIGLDYRMKDWPLTVGGSFNWSPGSVVQTSATESVDGGAKRTLDLYGLWKFDARTQLRIAASNLLARDYDSGRVVTTNGLAQASDTSAPTHVAWSIKLETKF
ncbi:TonB-dependent receptor plug domain-containing protein [Janthinobacterium fluminis]|uniref:TonB-dependent receptor n=1 Tax=Janthinobacterium fluminis TaxID=2987524 RepID=A0ABT5JYZ2_9BURK|nr:TonB-dependent receptor [Janthinobacterium fluminis]MDC8757701.1 TonB-dependent receptor [Janthinobacterium fluminis]